MMNTKKLLEFVLSASLFFVSSSFLQAETIEFRSDYMTGTTGNSETTRLSGNAFVKTESMEISADEIELSGDDFRYITATGAVSGVNKDSNMEFSCGRMKYDRTTKVANLEDSVKLTDNENEVTAEAQIIEYNQDSEIAVMQIEVTLKQKDKTCTSAFAIYRKKSQLLEMSGNPKIVQNSDTFRAQEITLNMDTQEITLDGRVSGSVTDTKEEKSETAGNPQTENTEATAETLETSTLETSIGQNEAEESEENEEPGKNETSDEVTGTEGAGGNTPQQQMQTEQENSESSEPPEENS